ncbi:hypothetical protein [Inconstantimicrobium mannanitabidum]|uniref:Uncharacterized protein n=1 Tax=Inconstantimicrobium mannanitabidum TaxID=1604901 RepID=A0ACB5RC27_9CLOT|nr:hypothetical protein [Clostridium sp. TW13]GKX66798.1 hypothetical protein rsdtw13_20560 [Clostridium sp. TW13]
MEELLKQILSKIDTMDKKQHIMQNSIAEMQIDITGIQKDVSEVKVEMNLMKDDIKEIKYKVDTIYDQTADLTAFRTETKEKLNSVVTDIRFIQHKLSDTEKDIFQVKDYLKIVK